MPNNDDDHRTYDHHVHVDHNDDVCTHQHDDHPRHHHDALGSIHYLDDGVVAGDDGLNVYPLNARPALIGDTGYDITHRTPRTTRPAP